MKFPKHLTLSIEHNRHKSYYESIDEYLNRDDLGARNELTDEEYTQCVETDELWEIQWYPITPISFHYTCAPTLHGCLEKLKDYED